MTNECALMLKRQNDVAKHQVLDVNDERRRTVDSVDLAHFGNKKVISWQLEEQPNHCPSAVEKIWDTVALGLRHQYSKSSPILLDSSFTVHQVAMK